MESLNAEFIRMNIAQDKRLEKLNQVAIIQLNALLANTHIEKLLK
jgi:hypothetical protein